MLKTNHFFIRFFIIVVLGAFVMSLSLQATSGDTKMKKDDALSPPPQSLDDFYPPKANQPVYLFMMFEMSAAMSGIVTDLMENDLVNVKNNFEKFKTIFQKVSNLIPEWKHYFKMDTVDTLGIGLQKGEKNKIFPALEAIGAICASCHYVNMPKVQFKYHWEDFSDIKVTDPLIQQEMPFQQFKHMLEGNFNGIMMSLQQSQNQNAKKYFIDFRSRFQTLKETCQECHGDSERKYYVDAEIMEKIDILGNALNSETPKMEKIGGLIMDIGANSCGKCHRIHGPAALTKILWK